MPQPSARSSTMPAAPALRRAVASVIALVVLCSMAAAAAPGAGGAVAPAPSSVAGARSAELVIFEAASLKEVFAKLARRFEREHPGTKVVTNAAGSQELRAQIEHGAVADVFASADRKHVDALVAQGLADPPQIFACNEPVVVVRAGLAATVKTFADLPRAERLVVGAPDVPIGAYAARIVKNAASRYGADFAVRLEARVASRELNVRQVLAKVVLGEADAGIVYRSDALAAPPGTIGIVTVPAELNVRAEYPLAVLKQAPQPELARQWSALVTSQAGAAALLEAGFVACPKP